MSILLDGNPYFGHITHDNVLHKYLQKQCNGLLPSFDFQVSNESFLFTDSEIVPFLEFDLMLLSFLFHLLLVPFLSGQLSMSVELELGDVVDFISVIRGLHGLHVLLNVVLVVSHVYLFPHEDWNISFSKVELILRLVAENESASVQLQPGCLFFLLFKFLKDFDILICQRWEHDVAIIGSY